MFALQMDLLRCRTGADRLQLARDLTAFVQHLPFSSLRQQHPDASDEHLWQILAPRRGVHVCGPSEPFHTATRIGAILDARDIEYAVGGGVAVCFYGEPRSTLNLDVLVNASEETIAEFEGEVDVRFSIAEESRRVHRQLARRRAVTIDDKRVWFYAPEDLIITKLAGKRSEQQWRDVIGILRISRDQLDVPYLLSAAAAFEVTDLLARARADAASL